MRAFIRGTAMLAVLVGAGGPVFAQEDFRAADQDRPLQVEDAYPVKFLEWEWELGTRLTLADGGRYAATGVLEIKTGIARNWQVGLEAEPGWEREPGAAAAGIEAFGGHVLYNVNQETRHAPAVSVRGDVWSPGVGDRRTEDVHARLRAILTRSHGRARLHLNAAYTWASATDGDDFWSGGLGFDYPIGLFSKAILGDVYIEAPAGGGPVRAWSEVGARFQLTNSTVLDVGLASRIDEWADGTPNVGVVIGVSRVFGIAGLVRVPRYPDPRID